MKRHYDVGGWDYACVIKVRGRLPHGRCPPGIIELVIKGQI
jgi:hypothetical protein